jgi:L-lactate dehydrogenase (cytochrome)
MIISSPTDYRRAAQKILPPFLFHYIDGGAYREHTLKRNEADLADIALKQQVLRNMFPHRSLVKNWLYLLPLLPWD